MPNIGNHRLPIAPVPPPRPVGSSSTVTIGASAMLAHQIAQARLDAAMRARKDMVVGNLR